MSVAKPLPHDAARLHVTGAARYVDDTPTPRGTLHLAFGLSPIAKGRITQMDLEPARQSPGVVAVLSADDLPFDNDVSPSNHDEPLLTSSAVNYVGQPVFLVVATSHRAARIAARKAVIDYAEETPLLTLEGALAADSRFEEGPRIYQKGDAAAAISAAPRMVEGSFDLGGQEHFYLEGQAALAQPQEDGGMLVNSSTQHPTEIQHKVAEAIGLPMHAVRVETRRMGGGFGGKESQGNALAVACAVAARHTGRPCKMRYDRDDDMVITGKRHAFRISYRAGFDTDGRLLGVEFTHLVDCGWAQDLSLPVADRAMLHADNAYAIPAIRIESHRLKTNRQSATAYRGFGGPQGMVGIERVMDHIAHDLKLDPVELRQRNYYAAPGTATGDNTTPYGMEVSDFELHEMTAQLLVSADYAARKAEIAAWNQGQTHLKRGLAFSPVKFGISFTLTHLNQAGALVHVYQDGSVHLNHGGTEMGQGLFQKVAQVAASRFGISLEKVKITATDTAKVPNTSATAASSGSDLNGMAVKAACDTIRARMAEHLANLHQAAPADVIFADGVVRIGDALELSFVAAAKLCYEGRISLSSTGFYKTPKLEWDRIKGQGRPFFYFAYGAALTEVVVDRLTGENRILRADILHDAGASLNPALDIGQVEGGYVQGAGWLTTEELVWDDKGALRTHAPSTYKIPACSDRPDVFYVALFDGQNREETIYRSKAVGEPPFMLGISAWLALSDAVSAFGAAYPALDAPATAEEIWRAARRTSDGG
ncbi:MAG: xanthine dehydrogenase molybdopterin binding subunit [Pseudophaeobacter sp. bin_em_oilr2.035]|uniref:Xanthine dehydrogenase molybdopterin binding subunit n=1 Tax=Phaeobacter gallaeciensis TaxID=60890 RepID=A0ABD4XC78_9RHOB|nr:xanthine dehydrogenase molybdopterin binding subunit [Phaeobacter gallaeciensis]MDF1774120.1 xanthine dehydrogenase molybdopterin binding subunit [Pseudophaeobacter sp. bin_em_oilr2.035]MDE4145987.1 xanthine dehydrogenase molybdopterin binding subunit [Phaeobacter gallaeciensis]MDE4158660.1 xanthine dehydrogenase molybdopterin binding subunit [Phaeobacter gallaeciensis]MDE4162837.1 xanthine dehydrogenase molybdopterin binding subunit [Phaeobacter gallaeciensis]MDE4167065.1 xanthine dehydrog